MALSDILPDRPLSAEEFEQLQDSDEFESVHTGEPADSGVETLVIATGDAEYMLHFTPDSGWHKHEH
jgi:hypothetical protein